MATALSYELEIGGPRYQRIITYGKCTESPNVESQLWFVTIKRGGHQDAGEPTEDSTFLVSEIYARPSVFEEWKRDLDQWHQVAHKRFVGNWCVRHEILYKDIPVYQYSFNIRDEVRYAYCKTVSSGDLWYVAFKLGDTHLVRREHATPEFFERVGTNQYKWMLISLGGNFASYGIYDELVEGNLSPDLINRLEPGNVGKDTEAVLAKYEEIVLRYEKKNKKGPKWYDLDRREQESWIKRLQDRDNELIPIPRDTGL